MTATGSLRRLRSLMPLALLVLWPAASALAQAPQSYRAPDGALHWVSDNPFRLFLVRNGDTVPGEVRGITVWRERWTQLADGFQVNQDMVDVGLNVRRETDSMTVSSRGEVLTVNGGLNYGEGEWDALLRLPAMPLTIGYEWSDTIAHPTPGPHGEGRFEVRRRYRVSRHLDSAGIRGLEVTIEATLVFRLSMWTDSSSGQYRWFDLTGPATERFVFDTDEGLLALREWSMLLEGTGGDFDGTTLDTVAAGLRSSIHRSRIPAGRATALMAPLPGSDTSVTVRADGTVLFLHTLAQDPTRLVEGFRRADGMTGTARVTLTDSGPARWAFRWVDLRSDVRDEIVAVAGPSLLHDGEQLAPPTEAWGVAEHGMWGTVVPSVHQLGQVQSHPFAVYRPTARTWDLMTVTTRRFEGFSIVVFQHGEGNSTILLLDAEGQLLYEEALAGQVTAASRTPVADGRRREFEAILAVLQGG